MTRFPSGTTYPGSVMDYDAMVDPEQLLRRLAYGKAAPMLGPWGRVDARFFARLLVAMANSHVVLVKSVSTERTAYRTAATIRPELPPERFGIYVDFDPRHQDYNVLIFNKVTAEMFEDPPVRDARGDVWVGAREVARVLRVTPGHANVLMDASGLPLRRVGGKAMRQMKQSDLVVLANRKGRWRRRTRKAS